MFRHLIKLLLIAAIPAFVPSCIRDSLDDCGIYLEFIYDHNMEYADSFDPHVNVVDVFVFDSDGKYLFTKQSAREDLVGGKRMLLNGDMPFGTYKILTVGGLCDKFLVSDANDGECCVGETTLEEVKLALVRGSDEVSHEFPHLWFGETVVVTYQPERSVWPVHMVKNTNNFNLILTRIDSGTGSRAPEPAVPYTFEIITPEGAVYGFDNSPLRKETLTFKPYSLTTGTEAGSISTGYINTVRLFKGDEYPYRLIVRNANTFKVLWDHNLMELLENTKPEARPDGTTLPIQEYLDRQSDWTIVILHKGGGTDEIHDAFVALKVIVNDWIVWEHNIDV